MKVDKFRFHIPMVRRVSKPGWIIRALVGIAMISLVAVSGSHWRARAQTDRFVSPFGDDMGGTPGVGGMNDCTAPDDPCKTIQNAVNQSGSGDLIELAPGTYTENVTVSTGVTIQGDLTTGSTVNGGNTAPVFIIAESTTVTLNSLTITNGNAGDSSANEGGGIQNNGALTVVQSTINGNTATTGNSTGDGGGIYNQSSLTVINSTITGNSAQDGGGIFNEFFSTATVVNSTVSGNSANSAQGGGVFNKGTLNLTNTIIAGSLSGGDCVNSGGTIATNDQNLIQDGSCSPAVSGDPKLGPLKNNGGPTFTRALMLGSPAIAAGDTSVLSGTYNLATDQRGPGFPREVNNQVDIGAFESGAGCSTINATLTGGMFCPGGSAKITVTLSGGMPPYTVTLNNGGGTKTGPSPLVFTVSPAMTTTYMVASGTDAIGCAVTGVGSATATESSAINATLSGGLFCPGGSVNITVTLSGGAPPYTVTLNNSGGTKTGPSPLVFTVSPAMTTTYSVSSGTDSNGCAVTGEGSATATEGSAPAVTLNPVNQSIAPGSVSFTAAASGTPAPTVQWQVSTNGGASFTNIGGATSTTLTFTPTLTQSGNKYRAVFTNRCNTATTTAATLLVFDQCLKDDSTGNLFQFNSATGQYQFTRCSDGFTLSGTGVVGHASGILTLTDSKPDRRVSAGVNPGQRTGSAIIYLMVAKGVWQTFRISATKPSAVCKC